MQVPTPLPQICLATSVISIRYTVQYSAIQCSTALCSAVLLSYLNNLRLSTCLTRVIWLLTLPRSFEGCAVEDERTAYRLVI